MGDQPRPGSAIDNAGPRPRVRTSDERAVRIQQIETVMKGAQEHAKKMAEEEEAHLAEADSLRPPTGVDPDFDPEEELRRLREEDVPEKDDEVPLGPNDRSSDYYMEYAQTAVDNPYARKEVEARVEPIDFAQITTGAILQKVPIYPGVLEVTFRTLTGREKRLVQREAVERLADLSKENMPAARVLQGEILSTLTMAAHLHRVGNVVFPPLVDRARQKELSKESLQERIDWLETQAEVVNDQINANLRWFLDRVSRASRFGLAEHLGNG